MRRAPRRAPSPPESSSPRSTRSPPRSCTNAILPPRAAAASSNGCTRAWWPGTTTCCATATSPATGSPRSCTPVCFTDGTQATGDIAVAEAQGYAYDALLRTAALDRDAWHDPGWAAELESAAGDLRARFGADFWMADRAFPALALDGTGRRVDALASDAGHLLWSGILDTEQGRATGRRLMEDDFFSGWGIRTLAAGQTPYHPLSCHRGSIWPHDNAVVALALARYGLHREAAVLARALADAAAHHDHRLPEVISGYPRVPGEGPVPYPHSCSPQAWAAATPLALLTAVGARADT